MKLTLVFGTRPQIIKCVPVIRECTRKKLDITIINTGQHYDFELSRIFLEEFHLPKPRYNLEIGSGSHGWQTGNILIHVEETLKKVKSSVCLIPGDTNSAIASALAAVKLKIPVVHLEAGLRSFEEFMPEEINRRAIDHFAQLLFAPTHIAQRNLIAEGISRKKIVLSGDTMFDLYLQEKDRINEAKMPEQATDLRDYIVITLHRQENTEQYNTLKEILSAIRDFGITTVFPIHPRTKHRLQQFGLFGTAKRIKNLILIDPLGYHAMMKLMSSSLFVMTDSGGMQKEAFMENVPCITLRKNTEWIETLKIGANVLVNKLEKNEILRMMRRVSNERKSIVKKIRMSKNSYGDGKAGSAIVRQLTQRF